MVWSGYRQRWYKAGSQATVPTERILDLGNHTRRIFQAWTGDISASTVEVTFIVDAPKFLTAAWKTQYEVRAMTPYTTVSGIGWHDANSQTTLTIPSIVEQGNQTRHVFTGWTGDIVSSLPQISFTVDSPKLLNTNWKVQYQIALSFTDSTGLKSIVPKKCAYYTPMAHYRPLSSSSACGSTPAKSKSTE